MKNSEGRASAGNAAGTAGSRRTTGAKFTPFDGPFRGEAVVTTVQESAWGVPEAAAFLKFKPKTVRAMARAGEIPAARVGRLWRFDEDTLREWLQNKTRENVATCPSESVKAPRIGKSSSSSLAARLDEALARATSVPHRSWRKSSTTISGGKSSSGKSDTPGMTP